MYNSHILHSFSYKDTIHEEILLAAMFSQQRDNMHAHTRLRDAATLLQDNRATGCEFARNISFSPRNNYDKERLRHSLGLKRFSHLRKREPRSTYKNYLNITHKAPTERTHY